MQRTTLVLAVLFLAALAFGQEPANRSVTQPTVTQTSLARPEVTQPTVQVQAPIVVGTYQPEARMGLASEMQHPQLPKHTQYPAVQPSAVRQPRPGERITN